MEIAGRLSAIVTSREGSNSEVEFWSENHVSAGDYDARISGTPGCVIDGNWNAGTSFVCCSGYADESDRRHLVLIHVQILERGINPRFSPSSPGATEYESGPVDWRQSLTATGGVGRIGNRSTTKAACLDVIAIEHRSLRGAESRHGLQLFIIGA